MRCKLPLNSSKMLIPAQVPGRQVDALVARDREERPVIWASHLEGVLRDAARRLRHDSSEMLFGKAGGQRQRFILTSLYVAQDPGCRIWRSAARDSFENRAPKDDTLRAVEFVPKGTRFEGSVELSACDVPLLDRLIAEVDAIGRGRAAGEGRVKLTLAETELNPAPGRANSATALATSSEHRPHFHHCHCNSNEPDPGSSFHSWSKPIRRSCGVAMGGQRTGCCYKVGFGPDIGERWVAASETTDRSCPWTSSRPHCPSGAKRLWARLAKPLGGPSLNRLHGGSINGWRKTRTTRRRRSSNAPRPIYLCAASNPVLRGRLIVRSFEFGFERASQPRSVGSVTVCD